MSADTPRASPLPNSYWVLPGRWLAGEYPGAASEREAAERIGQLRAAGIDAFVDLTAPGEMPDYQPHLPLDVDYVRLPLEDHGVPADAAQMEQILAEIDTRLAHGRRIYLHCRAGIGRTGTVVGCHLISRGYGAAEAIRELNVLWKQCARSKKWPTVPETSEQLAWIEAWQPRRLSTFEEATLAGAAALRDRFAGAMLGLAIGDALAAPTQQRKPGTFTPVETLAGGGPFELPSGAWSDDTAMALCLAESLVECGGFDPRHQVATYVRWQREGHLSATGRCVGIRPSSARALGSALWRRQKFAGSHDPRQLDVEPLPRAVPAVLFHFASVREAVRRAADAARTTAQAPVVLDACRYYGAVLHAALSGRPKAEVLGTHAELFRDQPLKHEIARLAEGGFRDVAAQRLKAGPTIVEALEASLAAFHRTTTFREGALLAANLGGDSDAATAAYGALAGAYYSAAALPPAWRQGLMHEELIAGLADRMLAQALPAAGG